MNAKRPTLPMPGGCSCGTIRYEIASFPLLLYTCHCADCQTASGGAFALNMPVLVRGFRILQGEDDFNALMSTWRAMWPEFFPQK